MWARIAPEAMKGRTLLRHLSRVRRMDIPRQRNPCPMGDRHAASSIVRSIKYISHRHFEGRQARNALKNERDFFHQWRRAIADQPTD
eukprot:9471655-Pyramimonas_sp.AAC.1